SRRVRSAWPRTRPGSGRKLRRTWRTPLANPCHDDACPEVGPWDRADRVRVDTAVEARPAPQDRAVTVPVRGGEEKRWELLSLFGVRSGVGLDVRAAGVGRRRGGPTSRDRKSTRLNSS